MFHRSAGFLDEHCWGFDASWIQCWTQRVCLCWLPADLGLYCFWPLSYLRSGLKNWWASEGSDLETSYASFFKPFVDQYLCRLLCSLWAVDMQSSDLCFALTIIYCSDFDRLPLFVFETQISVKIELLILAWWPYSNFHKCRGAVMSLLYETHQANYSMLTGSFFQICQIWI